MRIDKVLPTSGGRYESPVEYGFKTDADGRFQAKQVPEGRLPRQGYYRPGLGMPVTTPKADVELKMMKAGSVRVTADFAGKQPQGGYMVSIKPEGGEVVGGYSGSGNRGTSTPRTSLAEAPRRRPSILRGLSRLGMWDPSRFGRFRKSRMTADTVFS